MDAVFQGIVRLEFKSLEERISLFEDQAAVYDEPKEEDHVQYNGEYLKEHHDPIPHLGLPFTAKEHHKERSQDDHYHEHYHDLCQPVNADDGPRGRGVQVP